MMSRRPSLPLRSRWLRTAAAAVASLGLASCTFGNQDAGGVGGCSALRDQTITLVVPFSPGGGYDTVARIVAPALGEQLDAQVVVENQDGAGGLLAINRLVKARTDGTQIAIMNGTGTAASVLGGADGADFSLQDLSYIGRVATEDTVLVGSASGDYDSWDDVLEADGFRFGSTGPGATDYITPSLLIDAFDLDAEIVTGFPGQNEVALALVQGNVDGVTGPTDTRRAQVDAGEAVPLLSVSDERSAVAPDAPALGELDLDGEAALLMDSLVTLNEIGRPLVAPAGVPDATLTCLRDAFDRVAEDRDVRSTAAKQKRDIGYASGPEVDATVTRIEDLPKPFVTALKRAF